MPVLGLKAAKICAGLRSRLGRRALRVGVGMSVEHRSVLARQAWGTIVDIGANRGQFALAALHIHPHVKVHSFEPLEAPSEIYREILGDHPRARLYSVAIGPSTTTLSMHVSARDDSSSLLPIGAEQEVLFPGTAKIREEAVRVAPLASFVADESLRSPVLLKIDVQGSELSVLEGCEPLLHRFAAVYVECSYRELYVGQALAGEVVSWLHNRGFALKDIHNMARDGSGAGIQGDFYFERSPIAQFQRDA